MGQPTIRKLPPTIHDARLDPHAWNCAWRRDVQLEQQHNLFAFFEHTCDCGVWEKKP